MMIISVMAAIGICVNFLVIWFAMRSILDSRKFSMAPVLLFSFGMNFIFVFTISYEKISSLFFAVHGLLIMVSLAWAFCTIERKEARK